MSVTPTDRPSIQSFAPICRASEADVFCAQYGGAFLLSRAPKAPPEHASDRPEWTVAAEQPASNPHLGRVALDYLVLPVRRRKVTALRGLISVGRAESCDVIVSDMSVSVYHAFFIESGLGEHRLQDAGSKNGTFLEDQPVPRQGKGQPVAVNTGDRVRFGDAVFLFMGGPEFHSLVRQLTGGSS